MGIALALVSIIFFLLFLYPYIIYPVILTFFPKEKINLCDNELTKNYKVALLFCAYNEEDALPQKIDNLRNIKDKYQNIEIYAYSDCSSDATNKILQEENNLLTFVCGTKRMGKVKGMQKLVSMTKADILIFTDANVIVQPDTIGTLIDYFSCPDIGSVACTLIYKNSSQNNLSATSEANGLYWKLEEKIKQLESYTGSTMGADGAFFARRSIGYPELPADLVDDMAASLSVMFHATKMRCISAPDVIAYECSVSDSVEEFKRKKRIACGSYSTYRYFKSEIDNFSHTNKFKFYSHKVLRWWGIVYLLLAFIFLAASFFTLGYGLIFSSLILFSISLFWALIQFKISIAMSTYEIIKAIAATGIGVFESLCGRKYRIWEPANSRNQ